MVGNIAYVRKSLFTFSALVRSTSQWTLTSVCLFVFSPAYVILPVEAYSGYVRAYCVYLFVFLHPRSVMMPVMTNHVAISEGETLLCYYTDEHAEVPLKKARKSR
jgi:hypothetical protein